MDLSEVDLAFTELFFTHSSQQFSKTPDSQPKTDWIMLRIRRNVRILSLF
jgi:hypothetical protein